MSPGSITENARSIFDSLKSLGFETLFVGAILICLFALGAYFGRRFLHAAICSSIVALGLFLTLPSLQHLIIFNKSPQELVYSKLLILAALSVLALLPIGKSMRSYDAPRSTLFSVAILSVCLTTFILAMLYHVVPFAPIHNFSAPFDSIFGSPWSVPATALISLAAIFFFP